MAIEITVRNAILAHPALEGLGARDLPQKAAWRIGRMIDLLEPINRRYGKQVDGLVKKYGTPDEKGLVGVRADSPKRAEFDAENDELLEEAVKIDYDPIPLSLFKRKQKKKDKEGKETGDVEDIEIEMNGTLLGRSILFFAETK